MNKKLMAGLVGISLLLGGCATEQSRTLEVAKVTSASSAYQGQRSPIAVGKFDNRSSYMRGLFSDGVDRLGGQAKTILITHLQQSNRFNVLDRDNMNELAQESAISNKRAQLLRLNNSKCQLALIPDSSNQTHNCEANNEQWNHRPPFRRIARSGGISMVDNTHQRNNNEHAKIPN